METTHENSRLKLQFLPFATVKNLTKPSIERELLEKTRVLNHALLARLKFQFLPSATATLHKNMERDYLVTELKIQPIDTQPLITIQNGNCKDSSQLEKINQLSFFDSFNCVDKVAVSGNNLLLSQSTSAAPQRQCGFFMSAIQQNGGIAPLCRVYTPKYDTRKGNMGSGTCTPRVKPDTLTISTVSGVLNQVQGNPK